jgi:hypothetical protein
MAKVETKEFNVEMQFKSIELLKSSLNFPADSRKPITHFNFNVHIENRSDAEHKLVFVIVHVEIKNDDYSIVLGALSVSCIFEIVNFEDVIQVDAKGKVHMPQRLLETMNSISISTTRGLLFSAFKGTYLHGAILPIIDPKQFQEEPKKGKK